MEGDKKKTWKRKKNTEEKERMNEINK